MQQYGIKDIEIKRVVRIHNKFIRNKFEEKMESLVDVSNQNHKKSLEYLFYGVDPNFSTEIQNVIEEGFRPYNVSRCLMPGMQNNRSLRLHSPREQHSRRRCGKDH